MSFDGIWKSLCRQHPDLEKTDAKVIFSADNLKKLLEKVYERGQKSSEVDLTMFERIFGMK